MIGRFESREMRVADRTRPHGQWAVGRGLFDVTFGFGDALAR
jgi:hypothetical protein